MRSTLLLATFAMSSAALPATAHAGWLSDFFESIRQCQTNSELVPQLEADLTACRVNLSASDAELEVCFDDVADLDAALTACEEASLDVSSRRGGLASSDDGLAFVSFPPGALKTDTRVTVVDVPTPKVDTDRVSGVYDFGPDGLQMTTEATICFELDDDQAEKARQAGQDETCLGFFDESTGSWECEDGCLETLGDKGGLVCGETDHFTNFALLLSGKNGAGECASSDDAIGVIDQTLGGAVGLDDRSAFVNVPSNALLDDTEFTFDVVDKPVVDVKRASAAVDIGPDGARFLKRITVCLEVDPSAMTKDACLAYLDVDAKGGPTWVCEDEALETDDDRLYCGTTDHLTVYAIATGIGTP